MSQHPLTVPSGSGLAVRTGFNNAIDTLATLNAGPSAPASPQAGMLWLDTATGVLKIRNVANTSWGALSDMMGSVRHDVEQSLTSAARLRALNNIFGVSYEEQTLTQPQRLRARQNIWAAGLSANEFSGDQKINGKLEVTGEFTGKSPGADATKFLRGDGTWEGDDRTWQQPERSGSAIYQNTTGRTIQVVIRGRGSATATHLQVSADGVNFVNVGAITDNTTIYTGLCADIPHGHYYRLSASLTNGYWSELR